ncbi:trehalose operon repressor [Staphylococcus epidermidis]|jgi:trehalose operon repressor|uniref:Trehalose operon repressor n=4 Tax=Staphylococcus epidermidis TaxID=1282 RepID=A0A482KEH2_STAEP|nr:MULTISPECIES: trehalose operon repressor [Staphylococcus]EID35913.1 trehalose operon repressor [Staphylococcus epidermidis IS-250]MDU6127339.1 trehalose operon repressor [Veillonella sp.]CVZ09263.1 transcriptional regulator [Streptococcus pneumoniae]HEJ8901553.1 trehalose operon repressor [Staphylococcus aureus]ATN03767.1 trehalose operon repressor [Staphylococcus capitis]
MNQQKFAIIYDHLKKDISEGNYLYGELLPSEYELVEKYHSSRETVRKALELLTNDGVIQKIRGKGSIVIQQDMTEFPFSDLISFKEVKEKLNLKHDTRVLVNEMIKASEVPLVKEKLLLKNNELLCHVIRSRSINKKVKILDEDYFLTSVVPEISDTIANNSIYDYLEKELNLDISYSNKSITFEPFKEFEYQVFGKVHHPYTATVRSTVFLKDTTRFQYNISKHLATEFKFNEFSRRQSK